MSRIETSNTWEEGLVMDLNPLSTPKNVLTDCLNGTFITYNGNEFSLQNDQGNYKLEYCRLTPNYIPVGIKEYGDILYIVSHNPLDDSVEIGSYPSPLMITVPDEKNNNNEFESIVQTQILDRGLSEGLYTDLMENASNILFNGDDYKLNPGDEYCLQTEGEKPNYKYETAEYHILDEDSNIHDVTNKIILDENGNPKDFQHVAWTVPGWLSIKARLAELSVAGINIRSFYVPRNNDVSKTAHFAFNLRLNVNDSYLLKKQNDSSILNQWCSDITGGNLQDVRFRIFIEKQFGENFKSIYDTEYVEFAITDSTGNLPENFFLNECDWTEWYGDSRVLWKNISGKIEGLAADQKVRVRMIPVLYDPTYNYKIVYDNLEQSLLFDLASVEDDEWNLGNDLYQFYLSSDKKIQYIYSNISGPMISSFPVNLYGVIYDIKGNEIKSLQFDDYSGIGENVLQIPFDNTFRMENMYVIQFKFAPAEKEIGNFPVVTRFLITSEVFNDFTDIMVYDRDIKFDEWIKKYWEHNKTEFVLNYKDVDIKNQIGIVDEVIYENNTGVATESDIKYFEGKQYNTFFDDQNSGLSDSIKYRKGFKYNLEYNTQIKEETLTGDIWDGFNPTNKLMRMDYSSNTKVPFTQFESQSYMSIPISAYMEMYCKYQKMGLPFNFAQTDFWSFSDKLEELKIGGKVLPKLTGKLTDYYYNLNVEITGRKDEDVEQNNRSVTVKGNLYRNGAAVSNTYSFSQYVDGKNEKNAYMPYPKVLSAIMDNNLPFLLVKINYTLRGRSDNYELIQTIAGGPNEGDFTFYEESNTAFTLYYIAFAAESKDVPVLVPLSPEFGMEYFKNLCKKLSIALKEVNAFTATDRYILNIESTTQFDPRLTIYNVGQFDNLIYNGIDFSNKQNRIIAVSSLKNKLNLKSDIQYQSIIVDCAKDIELAMADESFVVFDKVLASVSFDSEDFPYVTKGSNIGINEIRMNILSLSSGAEKDFETWNNSTFLNEGEEISGLYCEDAWRSEDSMLLEMNAGYLREKNGIIYLSAKRFEEDEGITEKALGDKWKSSNHDTVISTKFKNKAQWFCWHNWWNSGAESDNYILLGGCLASNPEIRLDEHWRDWIKYEV